MRSLKYLFYRSFRPIRTILGAVLLIGMTAASIVFLEPHGSEDYLACKLCLFLAVYIGQAIPAIFVGADINGNRFTRSIPNLKQLKTVAVPLYTIISYTFCMVIAVVPHTVYVLASGAPVAHIADTLIIGAVLSSLTIALGTLFMHTRYGGIMMIYVYLPTAGLMFFMPTNVQTNGFGVDLGTAIVIFIVATIASVIAAFVISHIFYKNVDFKANPTQYVTAVK